MLLLLLCGLIYRVRRHDLVNLRLDLLHLSAEFIDNFGLLFDLRFRLLQLATAQVLSVLVVGLLPGQFHLKALELLQKVLILGDLLLKFPVDFFNIIQLGL